MDYGHDRSPMPTLEQERAAFLEKIERMETATEIARAVVAIMPKASGRGEISIPLSPARAVMIKDLISAGNKAGINRFTRSVYFEALASELGSIEAAQKIMMSPREAQERGIDD